MNILNTVKFCVVLSIISMCSCGISSTYSKADFSRDYTDRNQTSIVSSWGIPAEILIRTNAGKLGENVVTWVYYLEDESGEIAPVFFNFKDGKSLATNAFGGEQRRVLNVNIERDLKKILSERSRIKQTWPIWN